MAKYKVYEKSSQGHVVKVHRDSDWQEFIVKLDGYEPGSYHCQDKQEAIQNADHMLDLACKPEAITAS